MNSTRPSSCTENERNLRLALPSVSPMPMAVVLAVSDACTFAVIGVAKYRSMCRGYPGQG